MKFRDIKKFPHAAYRVDVGWHYLEKYVCDSIKNYGLDLDPDFQRAHVWDDAQRTKYVEYILQGGTSGRELYFNCPEWSRGIRRGPYVIVDGKQRLRAVRMFLNNEIPAFGHLLCDYTDRPDIITARFSWNIAELETRAEVLNWYLDFNAGGAVHTEYELARVRELLKKETEK